MYGRQKNQEQIDEEEQERIDYLLEYERKKNGIRTSTLEEDALAFVAEFDKAQAQAIASTDQTPGDNTLEETTSDRPVRNPTGRPVKPAPERFARKWKLIKRTGCHQWLGAINKYGKSSFYDGKHNVDPQVYAWQLEFGAPPKGPLQTTCKTIGCVCVLHLQEMEYSRTKRKQHVFEKQDVWDIRRAYDSGESVISISKRYANVSEQSVGMAARRKSYTWVAEEEYANTQH